MRSWRHTPSTHSRVPGACEEHARYQGGRYLEVMRHLAARRFAAFALDYRGHGQAAGQRGHVDSFAQYHADLGQFLEAVTSETSGLKRFRRRLISAATTYRTLRDAKQNFEHAKLVARLMRAREPDWAPQAPAPRSRRQSSTL